jgi:hypothetical protein
MISTFQAFQPNFLCAFVISSIRATCPTHITFHYLMFKILFAVHSEMKLGNKNQRKYHPYIFYFIMIGILLVFVILSL